jgi:hypothetical protein
VYVAAIFGSAVVETIVFVTGEQSITSIPNGFADASNHFRFSSVEGSLARRALILDRSPMVVPAA